jgi:CDP-diacylglycerol--glycerol-3-phosphate 3-phosphatidyltransferase
MWTVPNFLTMGRILSAPVVALAAMAPAGSGWTLLALVLFVVAALTDYLDGWLARALDQRTPLGVMLDPIADKAMVIVVLAAMIGTAASYRGAGTGALSEVPALLVSVPALAIVLRELLVSGLREFLGDVKLPVTQLAKWKTTAQLFAIGALLFVHAAPAMSLALLAGAEPGPGRLPVTGPLVDPSAVWVALGLLWLAAALTVWTGWDYFRQGWPHLAAREGR